MKSKPEEVVHPFTRHLGKVLVVGSLLIAISGPLAAQCNRGGQQTMASGSSSLGLSPMQSNQLSSLSIQQAQAWHQLANLQRQEVQQMYHQQLIMQQRMMEWHQKAALEQAQQEYSMLQQQEQAKLEKARIKSEQREARIAAAKAKRAKKAAP